MGLLIQQVTRPFLEDLFGPSRPEQTGVIEAQENVPLPEGKQDVRIEENDEPVGDVFQEASNS